MSNFDPYLEPFDRAENEEIILFVGFEGGISANLGINALTGWRFRVVRDESTMGDPLSDEDREGLVFRRDAGWVDSLESAQAILGDSWHMNWPLEVHPDFRRLVWAAVQDRCA